MEKTEKKDKTKKENNMRKYELIMACTQRTLLKYRPTTAYTNKNPIMYVTVSILHHFEMSLILQNVGQKRSRDRDHDHLRDSG